MKTIIVVMPDGTEEEVTEDMMDFHKLEWGVEMDGKLYMDGCSDAEFGECAICGAIDAGERGMAGREGK